MTGPTGPVSPNSSQSIISTTGAAGTFFPTFVSATSGTLPLYAQAELSYNPGNGILAATAFNVATTSATLPLNGVYSPVASSIGITTAGTERVRIDSNGLNTTGTFISKGYLIADSNTSAPNFFTRVFGGGSVTGSSFVAMLSGSDGVNRYRNSSTHIWENQNGTTEYMRVDMINNRLGVMTSNPQFTLDVNGTARISGALTLGSTLTFNQGLLITGGGLITTNVSVTGSTLPTNGMYLPGTNILGFATNSGEKIRIDTNGNVSIGTTVTSARLRVDGSANSTPLVSLNDSASNNGATLSISATSSISGVGIAMLGNGAVTPNKYIRTISGQLEVVNSAYSGVILTLTDAGSLSVPGEITAYSSDARLKDNVTVISDAVSRIRSIRGVTFDWNDRAFEAGFSPAKRHDVGVIAQEIMEVLPEAVRFAPFDRDVNRIGTSKSGENYLTVQYEKLTALLIEAVKELAGRVEELEKNMNGRK